MKLAPVPRRHPGRNLRLSIFYALIGLVLAAATGGCAPSPDWNGTWKLNPAESDIPGPTLTVSITPDDAYHFASGGGSASYPCDGKEHRETEARTASCTRRNSSDMEITVFKNGSKAATNHWSLSSDEKVLTIQSSIVQADGSVKSQESRYTRTAGSTGFAGGWRNVNPLASIPLVRQIRLQGRTLHQSFPEKGRYMDVILDGPDAAIYGPEVSSGASIALKERNPRELDSTMKVNRQIVSVGYWRISADGRSLTEAYWIPTSPNEKAVVVYDKQSVP